MSRETHRPGKEEGSSVHHQYSMQCRCEGNRNGGHSSYLARVSGFEAAGVSLQWAGKHRTGGEDGIGVHHQYSTQSRCGGNSNGGHSSYLRRVSGCDVVDVSITWETQEWERGWYWRLSPIPDAVQM